MKATGGPQKLRFTIQSCSGEDSDYPVRELLYHSPQTRGWQSPRFCKYPQEFVLRLERSSKIQQLQILAHEYKIPTKVEVFVGPAGTATDAADPAASSMRRLGYLSFDSNERSSHQARELKSVHVSVEAQLVRLLIHRCHVNKLNIYNQVGIVALNLIGEPLQPVPEGPAPYLNVQAPTSHELPYYNRAAAEVADLQLDMHVDSQTAARIKELVRLKDAAVAGEDYDEAKRLKGSIERLKVVGSKIAQLEARKRLAVEREDYDLAKALKADIEKLRIAGESAAVGGPQGIQPGEVPDAAAGDVAAAYGAAADGINSPGDMAGMMQQASTRYSDPATVGAQLDGADGTAEVSRGLGTGGGSFKGSGMYDPGAGMPVVHTYQAYEDRPAVAKASYLGAAGDGLGLDDDALIKADPSQVSAAAMFGGRGAGSAGGVPGAAKAAALYSGGAAGGMPGDARGPASSAALGGTSCGAPAPAGWPGDLPPPEALSGASAKDADPVVEVAGEFVAAAYFSRNWQLRDAAAAWLGDLVANGRLNGADKRETAKGLVRLAVKGLKDKVPQVYNSSLGLLQALLTALAASGGARDVQQAVDTALPVLLERLSDNNPRLRDSARDALVALAQEPEGRAALRALTGQLCKPPKSQTAWRPVLAMLQLMQDLVPLLGLAGAAAAGQGRGSSAGEGGFDLHEVMDYVGRALSSANADVRAAALKVAVAVAGCAAGGAAAVRRLLPHDLNPKLKEQADAALGCSDAVPAAAPAPAQSTPQQGRQRSTGAGGGSGGGGGTAHRAAGKPTATSNQHPNRQAAAAAAVSQAQQHQQQQQQIPEELAAEDPAPFKRELAAREQQYGPKHPAVAESCSNLAILYNQKGDYAAAQPLYERALAIYESVYGPTHQEVAHTLTDLAVLHLEQGHDAVGRPLLERALAIQEAALGPNHPDVVAIRDVLNSE